MVEGSNGSVEGSLFTTFLIVVDPQYAPSMLPLLRKYKQVSLSANILIVGEARQSFVTGRLSDGPWLSLPTSSPSALSTTPRCICFILSRSCSVRFSHPPFQNVRTQNPVRRRRKYSNNHNGSCSQISSTSSRKMGSICHNNKFQGCPFTPWHFWLLVGDGSWVIDSKG